MSTMKRLLNALLEGSQDMGRFISGAMTRLFSPTDDQYPKTGVQPFEGKPVDKKHRHS